MQFLRILFLIIGLLGLASGLYGLVNGEGLGAQILPLLCGASLIYGYFFFGGKKDLED
jgi:hypothetical protein